MSILLWPDLCEFCPNQCHLNTKLQTKIITPKPYFTFPSYTCLYRHHRISFAWSSFCRTTRKTLTAKKPHHHLQIYFVRIRVLYGFSIVEAVRRETNKHFWTFPHTVVSQIFSKSRRDFSYLYAECRVCQFCFILCPKCIVLYREWCGTYLPLRVHFGSIIHLHSGNEYPDGIFVDLNIVYLISFLNVARSLSFFKSIFGLQ